MKISLIVLFLSMISTGFLTAQNKFLSWSTYLGGKGDEEGRGVANDSMGNIYVAGWTSSASGVATASAWQPGFGGFYDAYLSKFSKDGSLIWSTYFGGPEMENSFGIVIDKGGAIYICGSTSSTSGVASPDAGQKLNGGFTDAFIAKFNSDGKRIWSTYYGGAKDDEALGIASDSMCNIYITGFTQSPEGIATQGTYNTAYSGSRDNGFLAKFDSGGHFLWGTYYGGVQNDYSFAVATDNHGNAYIAGTASSPGGIASSGAFRKVVGGYYDGFLAKFSSDGQRIWGTYYGNDGDDECTAIGVDVQNNIFITGNTSSASGIATKGTHQENYSGGVRGYDVFLAKFSSDGNQLWSTYYGGAGDDFAWGLDIGLSGNIFISGYTYSDTGIATTGSYQTGLAGINDAYAASFSPDGALEWGTYFGGADKDFGYAVKADPAENVYITGLTYCKTGIRSAGVFQDSLSGTTDAFIVKFTKGATGFLNNNMHNADIQIYPNPFRDAINIRYGIPVNGHSIIQLIGMNGKILNLFSGPIGLINQHFDLAAYGLKEGIYLLRIINPDAVISTIIIKE